ncbi:MAG: hypothetical protein H0X67_10785 [Acidobacteria bacterium]|nr:hypothetical protein [Acidobacteriota bacterium]
MTRETAETVADVLLGVALLGAAVLVLRTPALRRIAVGLATTALTTTLPTWIGRELKQAWVHSAPPTN